MLIDLLPENSICHMLRVCKPITVWLPANGGDEDNKEKNSFSVEEGIAETLGIKLNDSLTYSVAGQEISGKVDNLRWVEWDSFNVNFFVVSNPAALKNYPSTFISSLFIPESERSILIDLVKQYPSITVFDVDALLKQVRAIMKSR